MMSGAGTKSSLASQNKNEQGGKAKQQATLGGLKGGFLNTQPPAWPKSRAASTAAAVAAAAAPPAAAVAEAEEADAGANPVPEAAPVAAPVAPVPPAQVVTAAIDERIEDQPSAAVIGTLRMRLPKDFLKGVWKLVRKKWVPSHTFATLVRNIVAQAVREAAVGHGFVVSELGLVFQDGFFNTNQEWNVMARMVDFEFGAEEQLAALHGVMDQLGGVLPVDLKIGGVRFGADLERTRGTVREPSWTLIVNLFNEKRLMCKDAIARMAASKGLGPVEFSHIGRADANTFGPYESCELNEEAPLLRELGWRQEKTGTTVSYQVMSPLFWETSQEQRFMLVRSQGANGVSVNTWLKVRLVRVRPGEMPAQPLPWLVDALARRVEEIQVAAAKAAAVKAEKAVAAKTDPPAGRRTEAQSAPRAAATATATTAVAALAAVTAAAATPVAAVVVQAASALAAVGRMGRAEQARAQTDRLSPAWKAPGTARRHSGPDAADVDVRTSTETPLKRGGAEADLDSPARLRGRNGRHRVPTEPETSALVLFEQEQAEEEEDFDPLSQMSLGGMMDGMGLNEMHDKG